MIEGHWPDDCDGAVVVVGPDKRAPGGHWFGEPGLLCRIDLAPLADGRIRVRHRRVRTPLARIRERVPFLFAEVAFMELSPLGVSNLANTNVQPIEGRLFVGYDAGRPVEVDPETLEVVSAVGANGEWFVNYSPVPSAGGGPEVYLARWDLDGEIQRWRLDGVADLMLTATATSTDEGRQSGRALWCAGLGFDPGVIPSTWWDLRRRCAGASGGSG